MYFSHQFLYIFYVDGLTDVFIFQLIFVNDIGVGKEDVVLVVNTSAEDILRREVQEYGLSIKVNNVSVDGMVKETLPNSQEGSEKREEEGIYDYSQYEPLFKVGFLLSPFLNVLLFYECSDGSTYYISQEHREEGVRGGSTI